MIRASKLCTGLALLLAAGVMLSACGPKQAAPVQPEKTDAAVTTATKKPAVGGQLNLSIAREPDNFNPILSSNSYGTPIFTNVYARLFEWDEKWQPTPYVAESWSASQDGLSWTIKIKQGIKFHDGNDLTADDVVFTLKSIMDKDYTGPRSASVASVKDVTASDKYTVVIQLKEPFAPILYNINYGILEKKLFEGTPVGEFSKHPVTMKPVGAGPYKFVEYKRGQYVILERNDNWFMSKQYGGAPFVKTLNYKIIVDAATALAALETGELDWYGPPTSDYDRLKKEYKDKLVPVPWERNGWGYMTFNVTRPHLNDKRVRQALTYGLDRQSIITAVYDNTAVIPAGPTPTLSWAYDPAIQPVPYDKEKAKRLLEEAGYKQNANGIMEKDGQPLKLTYYGTSGDRTNEGLAQFAKKNWKEIGVDLDVQLMDYNAMLENFVKPGKFDVSFAGATMDYDPDQYRYWHSSQTSGFNRGRLSSPEIDKLLEAGRKETDLAKRKAIYSEFQKKWVDEAPALLVYSNRNTMFYNARVKGVVNFPGTGISSELIYRVYINEQ